MNNSYTNNQLELKLEEDTETLTVRFLGKSILRDPNEFMMPILQEILNEARSGKRRIVMDFYELSYMNSSTLMPVIKILEQIRIGEGSISILYKKSLKWQDISFMALGIFQTKDHRIEIRGEG